MSDAFCDDDDREYRAVNRTVRYWTEHGMKENHWSPYTSDERILRKAYRIYRKNEQADTGYTPKHMRVSQD